MTLIGIAWGVGLTLVAAIGIGLIRVSRRERADMKLVEWSDRMTAPRDGARIAVCGVIEAEGESFESPVRRRPAVEIIARSFSAIRAASWSCTPRSEPSS